jgi:chemotaxis protein methyltransferase CheR
MAEISDREFSRFQGFLHASTGITLAPSKKALVSGRLDKRLRERGIVSYTAYFELLQQGHEAAEAQTAIDLLTTNETYFFREPRHFDLLRELALAARAEGEPLRVWSAACSSGEEAYSIAMVLDDVQSGLPWELLASDISSRMLARARSGHYPDTRSEGLPDAYRRRYCLRGTGTQAGSLLIDRALRQRVRFESINLNRALPAVSALASFDVIFLRNVMIYFDGDTKREVVARLVPTLKKGGHLLVGHSETLTDIHSGLRAVAPSVYCRK